MATTSAPGTLRTLRDAHINRGGEVEKRKAFVAWRNLPPGTVGLAAAGGAVYVFGTAAALPVPAPLIYQRLVPPDGSSVVRILDAKTFAGGLYVSALCSNGVVRHFYNGALVTAFTGQAPAQSGRIILPFNANVYAASGSVLYRSGTDTPTNWAIVTPGAAFFDMSSQAQGSEALTGLAEYQSGMAIFSRRTAQIWAFSADPAASVKAQTLRNVGCVSPGTCLSYAGTDVFFLGDSGVRSLRARDITNSPGTADVGTPIDDLVGEWLRTASTTDLERAHAIIEPADGRYWLMLGATAYVFSYFPSSKISAWSTYTLPGVAEATVAVDRQVYQRAGDTVFLYGGESGDAYDATEAVAELAFLDGRQIATWKRWEGLDIAAEGGWSAFVALQPSAPDVEDMIATMTGATFHQLDTPMLGEGPAVKLRFVSTGATAARLGAVAAHYTRAE
jgi:hypothetical protein